MHVILIPGLWLAGDSWAPVADLLRQHGHTAVALTLPGLESRDAERSGVVLEDHLAAVLAEVDQSPQPAVVVGHSASANLAHLAADARPGSIARTVLIGGFPASHGEAFMAGFDAVGDDVAFPGWEAFEGPDTRDLDDADRVRLDQLFRPSPLGVLESEVHYQDPRRHQVPTTVICTEFSAEDCRGWMAAGHLPELAHSDDLQLVDLESGHWPQITRAEELAEILAPHP